MDNNFIYAKNRHYFLDQLGSGNIKDESIVFIADSREIWNHGVFYKCDTSCPDFKDDFTNDFLI